MREFICIVIGFGLCGSAVLLYELRPKKRHVLRGNYFDARAPFEISSNGGPTQERTDESIDKVARRLGRLKRRTYADSDASS